MKCSSRKLKFSYVNKQLIPTNCQRNDWKVVRRIFMLTYLKVKAGYHKLGRQKQIITVVLPLGLVFSWKKVFWHCKNYYSLCGLVVRNYIAVLVAICYFNYARENKD